MAHARISKVTFKSGGAELRILNSDWHDDLDESNWRGLFVEHARTIADNPKNITGYVMVAVYEDGTFNSASRVDCKRCAVPLSLWPSYVEEIARRKLLTAYEPVENS